MPQIVWREVRTRGLRPDWNLIIQEVEKELRTRIGPEIVNYFQKIVASWDDEDRPRFTSRMHISKSEISVYVYPTGSEHQKNVWTWVSITGTKPHPIPAKNAKYLKYRTDYKPRTTRSGGYKGPGVAVGPWRTSIVVQHPGFQPRNFEAWVRRWYLDEFRRLVENAFKRGIYHATRGRR